MTTMAATIYFVATLPLLFYIVFSDLRYMRIYNWSNIALFLIFLILSPFFFEWIEIGWRLVAAAVMFAVGFVLNISRLLGGGDAKFLPAAAPYVALSDATFVMVLLAALSIIIVILHRAMLLIPPFKRQVADWVSWNDPRMNGRPATPYGVALAATLSAYLFLKAFVA